MSDNDDYLVEQQLEQEMGKGRPPKQKPDPVPGQDEDPQELPVDDVVSFINERGTQGASAATTSPTKRKRQGSLTEERSPNKRVAGRNGATTMRKETTSSPVAEKATGKKLGRPRKPQPTRHMIETYRAVRNKKGNIFEVPSDPERTPKHTPNTRSSKGASRQQGASRPARSAKTLTRTTRAAVASEANSSAVLNGRADVTERPERRASRAAGSKKSSGKEPSSSHVLNAAQDGEDVGEKEQMSGQVEVQEDSDEDEPLHPGSSQTHENDEDDLPDLDLLGCESDWKKVLEAAREVGGSRLRKNQIPKVRTETIKALVIEIRYARDLYQGQIDGERANHDQLDGPRQQLYDSLNAIEEQITHEDISEAKAFTKRSDMIYDIYAYAIPALVFLLESSLSFHALHPEGLGRYEAFQELVRVQAMIACLCEKAIMWKAKPNTVKSIIKPTRSVIFPYTRDMKKRFEIELKEQRRKWKRAQNAIKTARSEEERRKQDRRQKEELASQKSHHSSIHTRIFQDTQVQLAKLKGTMNGIGGPVFESSQGSGVSRPSTEWTEEEEKELIRQLKVGFARDQSTEARYLNILNTRLLQNKLPERVREQALSLKPYLLEVYGPFEWIESIK